MYEWNNVWIVDTEANYHKANYHKRLVSEMIHIKEQKNGINFMKDTELLDKTFMNIFETLK